MSQQEMKLSISSRDWKRDFLASIVVFLVALPLCMGIAIASGVPVAAGLVTGIIGGLVVGFLSGAPLQVSGPAAGLTVIVYELVRQHGLESLGLVVLLAGALQMTAGALRLGQWFRAVSPAVIKGMLAGIGILIFASQFHVMVDDAPKATGLQNLATLPEAFFKGLPFPAFGSREERESRTAYLKEFGALYDRQRELRKDLDKSRSPHATRAADLVPLAKRQREIQADIKQMLDRLDGFPPGNQTLARRVRTAATGAHLAVETALDDLQQQRVGRLKASQDAAEESLRHVLAQLKSHEWAAKLGLLTIIAIVYWQVFVPQRLRLVPAPLVAIVLATAVAAAFRLPVLSIQVPDDLMQDLRLPTFAMLAGANWAALLPSAVVVAIVASTETLLCATAVDQMHTGERTKYDRELCAQGIGNMLCGLLSALPMTGVIVRSATNVQAGAKSRYSAVLHGLWLLMSVVFLTGMLRMIPIASLAAMLVYTGYKLVDPASIKELWKYGKGEFAIYAATVGTIVAADLLTGVIVGIGLSALKLLVTFSRLRVNVTAESPAGPATVVLGGGATFLRLPTLARQLERVPRRSRVRVDADQLLYIDHACLDLLMSWARQHEASGGEVAVDWAALHRKYRRGGEAPIQEPPRPEVVRAAG